MQHTIYLFYNIAGRNTTLSIKDNDVKLYKINFVRLNISMSVFHDLIVNNKINVAGDVSINGNLLVSGAMVSTSTSTSSAGLRSGIEGTSSSPAYSFTNDTNTGMYSSAADNIDFATGGVRSLNITSDGLRSAIKGTSSSPAYSFTNDTNTGMYSSAADNIDFATNGVQRINIGSTGLIDLKGNKLIGVTRVGQNTVFAESNIGGNFNTAIGYKAGNASEAMGTWNTFVGHNAGLSCIMSNNTFMGAGCGKANITGTNNVTIGAYCSDTNTAGSNYVMIGVGCRMSSGLAHSNSVGIGANCLVRASNEIVFGDETSTNVIRSGRDNGVSLGTSNKRFSVIYAGNGVIETSDETQKVDIGVSVGLDTIMKLKPISYKMAPVPDRVNDVGDIIEKGYTPTRTHYGFSAQHIEELINSGDMQDSGLFIKAGVDDKSGMDMNMKDIKKNNIPVTKFNYGLRYNELIAPIVKSIHELNDKITALETKISAI